MQFDGVNKNPIKDLALIQFTLPQNMDVEISIFDILGRQIRNLVSGMKNKGYNAVIWDGLDNNHKLTPAGTYYVIMKTNDKVFTDKIVKLR